MDSFLHILRGFIKSNQPDWIIIKEMCQILINEEDKSPKFQSLIKCLVYVQIRYFGTKNPEWYCSCEQVINMIFVCKQNPETLAEYTILKCAQRLFCQSPTGQTSSENTPEDEGKSSHGEGGKTTRQMEIEAFQNQKIEFPEQTQMTMEQLKGMKGLKDEFDLKEEDLETEKKKIAKQLAQIDEIAKSTQFLLM